MTRKLVWSSWKNFITELSDDAEAGNWDAGEKLLRLFAELADDPEQPNSELVNHVAKCVRRFVNADFKERNAKEAFRVKRPAHRAKYPIGSSVRDRHIKALVAYFTARADGIGWDKALDAGMKAGSFGKELILSLLRNDKAAMVAALMQLPKEKRAQAFPPQRSKKPVT